MSTLCNKSVEMQSRHLGGNPSLHPELQLARRDVTGVWDSHADKGQGTASSLFLSLPLTLTHLLLGLIEVLRGLEILHHQTQIPHDDS